MSGFAEILNIQNCENWREIVYVIYVRNVWFCIKIEYPELQKFDEKFCTLYMYGTSGFAEILNIQNCENWREIVYVIYVRNVWFCRKIEYPELQKFDGKFCTLYMYGKSGFAEKLNIQNCVNSMANFVPYVCTECLDLQKNWISRTAKF